MKTNPTAKIVSYTSVLPTSTDPVKRRLDRFSDFVILASVFLFLVFIVLMRANSRLMLDYLNFIKLFSRQERDENLGGAKISGSFNVLIYLFACFLIALVLLNIHYHSGRSLGFIGDFKDDSLGAIAILWISLALTLFIGLFIKLTVLYLFSVLFDFAEILTLQFLNFMRVIFFGGCVTVFALLVYLVFNIEGNAAYLFLFRMLIGMLLLWLPLVFFKLLSRTSNRMFHLFSYLCPSEIFPVLVLIKVLFL